VVFGRAFTIHLGVVIEKVWVNFVEDPRPLENDGLHKNKE
jgi:hypothetical protein